jgi:hypothetical protein
MGKLEWDSLHVEFYQDPDRVADFGCNRIKYPQYNRSSDPNLVEIAIDPVIYPLTN